MTAKFRGWHKELEQMIYGKEVCGHIEYTTNLIDALNTMLNEDDYDIEVMQSTDLTDNNDVDIFEGDIVMYQDFEYSYIGIVRKDCYQFFIEGIEPADNFSFEDVADTNKHTANLAVIGNFYENPELLEGLRVAEQ